MEVAESNCHRQNPKVKTFIIPLIMYRAGLISIGKEVIIEANRVIFNFIWKGKDKVKRSSLISDMEDGGLKAPHLESIIKTQRILCCKKFASEDVSSWKVFFNTLSGICGKQICSLLQLRCGYPSN